MSRAVILAAGVGNRLRPLTDDRPKALVEVRGVPLIVRLAEQLARVGVDELIVATGHGEDVVRRVVPRLPQRVTLCRNDDYASTQNVVSLHACSAALAPSRETWKLDGDLFLADEVLERLARAPLDTDELLCAVDRRDDLGAEEMKVELSDDVVVRFGKALDPRRAAGESAGVERIGAGALSSIVHAVGRTVTAGERQLYYEDVYDRCLRAGAIRARAIEIGDLAWTEIDTPDDLQRAEAIARRLGVVTSA